MKKVPVALTDLCLNFISLLALLCNFKENPGPNSIPPAEL